MIYEPGEVKVVAFDAKGNAVADKIVKTAGKPHQLELVADRMEISADGKDLAYITVRVVDKDGILCPNDQRLIHFFADGAGNYKASANGDPTCLDLFHLPQMHAFNGQLTAIAQASESEGILKFEAKAKGLKAASLEIKVK